MYFSGQEIIDCVYMSDDIKPNILRNGLKTNLRKGTQEEADLVASYQGLSKYA